MPICLPNSIDQSCEDVKRGVGGSLNYFYALVFDQTKVVRDSEEEVLAVAFQPKDGYNMRVVKIKTVPEGIDPADAVDTPQGTGTATYPVSLNLKLHVNTPESRKAKQLLDTSVVIAVVPRVGRYIEVFGANGGLYVASSAGQTRGFSPTGQDATYQALFVAPKEIEMPLIFSATGDFDDDLAYLDALVNG
jgi:hypothetical protein